MKKIRNVLLVSMLLFAFSCEKSNDVEGIEEPASINLDQVAQEKLDLFRSTNATMKSDINQRVAFSYIGEICEDDILGTASPRARNDSSRWDYYYFNGAAGDVVSLSVTRLTPDMDPAMALYQGTTDDSSGVDYYSGGSNMTFLTNADDNVLDPFGSCYDDPAITGFVLPATGTYTVAVYDYLSCGPELTYVLQTEGIVCDSDGDGCPDNEDPHPYSILTPTVVINGCDTGVTNQLLGCSSMADILMDCCLYSGSYYSYRMCLINTLRGWLINGYINSAQRRALFECALPNYGNCSQVPK